MSTSPTLTLTTLMAQARLLAIGDSTSTSFSDADTLVAANDAYQDLIILAFSASGDWEFRGNNKTQTSITAATRSIALPTDFLRINRVEIKYPSGADYVRAKQIDSSQLADGLDEYIAPGVPEFDLVEGYLEIFVADKTANISAVTNGVNIYHDDDITALATGEDAPEMPQPFAKLMALKMAHYYCIAKEMFSKASFLEKEIQKREAEFVTFIANRSKAKRLQIKPIREEYGQSDLSGRGLGNPTFTSN